MEFSPPSAWTSRCLKNRYIPEEVRPFEGGALRFGYSLFIDGQAPLQGSFRRIVRSLWERYAIPAMGLGHRGEGGPAVAQQRRKTKRERPSLREALESFCREACRTMAATEWREFTLAGESCGGIIPGELSAQARLYPDGIWFQAWNNNLRTAYGLDHFGAKWKEPRLRGMSERIRNLFLAAPEESGLSPVVYSPSMKAWIGSIKYHGGGEDLYCTADLSISLIWALRMHQDLKPDDEMVARAIRYGEALCRFQLPSGAIPSYIQRETFSIHPRLRQTAQSAASAWFLLELYRVCGQAQFLEAAQKVAEFIRREVIPGHRYFDFETYYSCSKKPEGFFDPHTGLHAHNNLSLYWTVQTFRCLAEITGKKEFEDLLFYTADLLCLYQQVWDPPYLSVDGFGGFGVMNTDGEWNDMRQVMFAELLADLAQQSGSVEYRSRAGAALQAAAALFCGPENPSYIGHRVEICGRMPENFGHIGINTPCGRSTFHWCEGNLLTALAYIDRHHPISG